jgi:uncharacterized protein (DUF2147 family)
MKQFVLSAGLIVGLSSFAAADPAAGTWKTQPGDTGGYLHVTVAPCGAMVCGTITAAYDKDGAVSADYDHLGKRMLWDMKAEGDGSYGGGKIWAPDSDKTYNSKMSLNGNTLVVKGCVAGGLICRGQDWKRVN